MNRKDLHNSITVALALATTAVDLGGTATAALVGEIIDLQGCSGLEIAINVGEYTDGSVTPLIEHGDESNMSDAEAVADAELLGTEAAAALSAAGVSSIGYAGNKRYVRLTLTASASATLTASATAIKVAKRYEGATG